MRSLILLAALTLPAALVAASSPTAVPAQTPLPAKLCADTKVQWADRARGKAQLQNLGELPPGDLTLAVVREVDGCVEPVVVGYDYGAVAPRDMRKAPTPRRR